MLFYFVLMLNICNLAFILFDRLISSYLLQERNDKRMIGVFRLRCRVHVLLIRCVKEFVCLFWIVKGL